MAPERVQVRDLDGPERIKPASAPVDTYYRPAETPVSKLGTEAKWAKDLAEGLEIIRPSAERFAEAKHKEMTEEELKQGAEARLRNQRSFREAIATGVIPAGASPWFKKGYEQQSGRLAGMEYDQALRTAWSSSPVANSDDPKAYEKFVTDFRQNYLTQNQGSKANQDWFEGFTPGMNRAENNLSAQHVSHRQKEIERATDENTYREASLKLDEYLDWSRSTTDEATREVGKLNLAKDFSLWAKNQIALGQSGSKVNELLTLAIDAKVRESRDPSLFKIGEQVETPGGTLSGSRAFKDRRRETEAWVLDYEWKETLKNEHRETRPHTLLMQQYAEKAAAAAEEGRAKAKVDNDRQEEGRSLASSLIAGVIARPDRPLDKQKLTELAKLDPNAPNMVKAFQDHELSRAERIPTKHKIVAEIITDMQTDPDGFDMNRVYSGPRSQQFDSGVVISLLAQQRQIREDREKDPMLRDPSFQDLHTGVKSAIVGNEAAATTGKRTDANHAASEFYEAVKSFKTEKPNANRGDYLKMMRTKYLELITRYAPELIEQSKIVAKQQAEAALVEEQAREEKRNQSLDSRLRDMGVPRHILRAYVEAVAFGDEDSQAEILKKHPSLAPKKTGKETPGRHSGNK